MTPPTDETLDRMLCFTVFAVPVPWLYLSQKGCPLQPWCDIAVLVLWAILAVLWAERPDEYHTYWRYWAPWEDEEP